MSGTFQTVARAVRVECDTELDRVYLVFEVIDDQLKHTIRNDWEKDIPLQLIGKNLIRSKEK